MCDTLRVKPNGLNKILYDKQQNDDKVGNYFEPKRSRNLSIKFIKRLNEIECNISMVWYDDSNEISFDKLRKHVKVANVFDLILNRKRCS